VNQTTQRRLLSIEEQFEKFGISAHLSIIERSKTFHVDNFVSVKSIDSKTILVVAYDDEETIDLSTICDVSVVNKTVTLHEYRLTHKHVFSLKTNAQAQELYEMLDLFVGEYKQNKLGDDKVLDKKLKLIHQALYQAANVMGQTPGNY
jgi:hypothetical protein